MLRILKNVILMSVFILPAYSLIVTHGVAAEIDPNTILLKDYRPTSIYKIPVTTVPKAKYPAIDMHSHQMFAKGPEDIERWVKLMDSVGIEKTVILSMTTGAEFDSVISQYSKYPNRFELWCGFDYNNYDKPGYSRAAVAELERCVKLGARGVGEEGDKGKGMSWGKAAGMHLDDPRMDPLLEKCAELRIPVNIHF